MQDSRRFKDQQKDAQIAYQLNLKVFASILIPMALKLRHLSLHTKVYRRLLTSESNKLNHVLERIKFFINYKPSPIQSGYEL